MDVNDPRIPNPESRDGSPEHYCREIESYLCRKNDGHLIRIVGPAFDQVCTWAARGVPLKVACRGIDRCFERYYKKGPRRRPVRVEFCEADVLDVFDEWRRAVGIGAGEAGGAGQSSDTGGDLQAGPNAVGRRSSLPAHLDRVVARLTALRGGGDRSLDGVMDDIVRELDGARAAAKGMRGDARQAFIDRLRALDEKLLRAAHGTCSADQLRDLAREADVELAPFRGRMPANACEQAQRAAIDRLLRERFRLPAIAYD